MQVEGVVFLEIDDVISLHKAMLQRHGGIYGIRDRGLLESAIAQPRMQFCGEYLHKDYFHIAAAYLYHIAKNHPFVDGNKRAALFSAITFLDYNDIPVRNKTNELYELTLKVAQSQLTKEEIAAYLLMLIEIH